MGPWIKYPVGDSWCIRDADDCLIALTETETLANVVLAGLTGHYPAPPSYPINQAINSPDGSAPCRCQDCGYEAAEEAFWPSDGNPALHVCPRCGLTNCFVQT